jgi:hypothetical protein
MIVGMLISSALLCAIMWVVARHEAEIDFKVVLLICLGTALLGLFIPASAGLGRPVIIFAALAWALEKFCNLSWPKAILVTVIYVAASIGLALAFRS